MSTVRKVHGYLARFESARDLYEAARKVRDRGYSRWDAFSPFPIHGMDEAMGLGRSKLPHLVFCGGSLGFLTAVGVQFVTQVFLFPTVVQSKPTNLFTLPAYFPIMFELTILFSALTALFGLLALVQLPRLHHPLFESDQFRRVTDDGFFIVIEAKDHRFLPAERTKAFLEEIGGHDIELVEEKT